MKETRYYSSYEDDFEESANQNYALPESYEWIKNGILSRLLSSLVYVTAVVLGGAYCKWFLHMKVKGRRNLNGLKGHMEHSLSMEIIHNLSVMFLFRPCVFFRKEYILL